MKDFKSYIIEGGISKSFVLNMEEINYDKLIEFLKDMQSKNEKLIEISVESEGRKWFGCSKEKSSDNKSNKTELNYEKN